MPVIFVVSGYEGEDVTRYTTQNYIVRDKKLNPETFVGDDIVTVNITYPASRTKGLCRVEFDNGSSFIHVPTNMSNWQEVFDAMYVVTGIYRRNRENVSVEYNLEF